MVFRKLLEREESIPSWRELLYVYRRMEARGELRGGRFVQGFAGEQYALPQAVSALRESRKLPKTGDLFCISAADPLNLTGIITPGERVASQASQRVLYRDGVPLAFGAQSKVTFVQDVEAEEQWRFKTALLRH